MPDAFHIDELKLAFSYDMVVQVVSADGELARQEADFLQKRFPTHALRQCRFITDEGELTDRFRSAAATARDELPALPVDERKAIVRTLFRAALIDSTFRHSESAVVREAGEILGLTGRQIVSVLQSA